MRSRKIVWQAIFFFASVLSVDYALASESPGPPAAASSAIPVGQAASKPTGKIICEYETPTGSRLRERVCKTEEQLEAEKKARAAAPPLNLPQNQRNYR